MPALSRLPIGLPALLAVVALTAACTGGGPLAGGRGAAELVQSAVEREPASPQAALDGSIAVYAFGLDLYHQLRSAEDGNLVFSPYSAAIALAMARAGAEGETASQLDTVLHLAGLGDPHAAFNALDQALASRPGEFEQFGGEKATLVLNTANAFWGQRDFALEQPYLDTLARHYGTGMYVVDYVEDTAGARGDINDWVSERTSERIPELIPPGVLDELTRLVITNAIYLNAPWLHTFAEGGTQEMLFTRVDGSTRNAPLMSLGARLLYAAGDGYQAVELPYVGGELAMLVIVPDDDTFAAFEEGFDGATIKQIATDLRDAQVNLRFPRFEFRTQAALSDALKGLGMPRAFTEDAEFPRITLQGRLLIQDVLHEAFISVDEEGTEAAAATAVVMGVTSAPSDFVDLTVDRPFLFLIRDRETGAPLFLGRVLDPTE